MEAVRKPIIMIFLLCFTFGQAFAAQQQRQRTYQKQNIIYQDRKKTFQKQEFPNAGAYIKVSRKKPTINVNVIKAPQIYNQKDEFFVCGYQPQAIGCTRYSTKWDVGINCDNSVIALKIVETKKVIDITSRYKRNTCYFDVILKRELTHQSMNEKKLERVIAETSKQIISVYEQMQKSSRSCKKIKEEIIKYVDESQSRFELELDKLNTSSDKDDDNRYQFQPCKIANAAN